MINRMIAATIAFLIAVIFFAPNEASARSAGARGGIGHGAVGLGASRSINRSIGPGLAGAVYQPIPFAPGISRCGETCGCADFGSRGCGRTAAFWTGAATKCPAARSRMIMA